jgi:uncharacterized repeat protein (TIGR04076 family)
MVSKVKITVLKRMSNLDLYEDYARVSELEPLCDHFQEGEEFVVEMLEMPKGFCDWAWADIQRDALILGLGGNAPWVREDGVVISCCTDGLRPVVFKLERL